MNSTKQKAFTLVELIVVVIILAILTTIGFLSYSSYIVGVRDTNRSSQIVTLNSALEVYRTAKDLPIPEENIEIQANGKVVGFQGFAGAKTLGKVRFTQGGTDPKDDSYFSYYITRDRKLFQLMTWLEEDPLASTYTSQVLANSEYEGRFPSVYGKKIGILTDTDNTPVQEITSLQTAGFLDIQNTNNEYNAYISDDKVLSGTGATLIQSHPNATCRRVKQISGIRGSGEYIILPYGEDLTAFCHVDYPDYNFFDFIDDGNMENNIANNWQRFTKTTVDSVSPPHSLVAIGDTRVLSDNFTYIQEGKRYKLEGKFKSAGFTESRIFFGFQEYDEDVRLIQNRNVNNVLDTETTLTQDVASTDTTITFKDDGSTCANWQPGTGISATYFDLYASVAFDVDDSGSYDDLPNFNLSSYGLTSVVDNGSTCTLTLDKPVGVSYSSGTKIRMHSSGGTYNYKAAGGVDVPNTWTSYSGEVAGISKSGVDQDYFRKGTKFVKVHVIANYRQGNDTTLYIDDLKMDEY